MAQTILDGQVVNTVGSLPEIGSKAIDFVLTGNDMDDVHLSDFKGKNIILNIFPSIDTGVCSASTREFNKRGAFLDNTIILSVSKDLPFALTRFCAAEGINNVVTATDFRGRGFSKKYGVELIDGAFVGLLARVVIVIDSHGIIRYKELVPTIGQEPDYDAAIKAI